jgi:Na+-translocating ferredoxin:NAD+ oxidoreductase RnfA subunit
MLTAIIIGTFATVGFSMVLLLSMLFRNKLHIQSRIKNFVHANEKVSGTKGNKTCPG